MAQDMPPWNGTLSGLHAITEEDDVTYNVSHGEDPPSASIDNQSGFLLGPPARPFMTKDIELLQLLLRNLHLYYVPVLFALSLLGNVLSLVILTDKPLRSRSTTPYLLAICVVDTLHLLVLLHKWLGEYGIDLYAVGGWCQFVTFAQHTSRFLSIWCTVGLAIDRYIWTCHPCHRVTICQPSKAKIVLASLSIVSIVVYLNVSLTAGLVVLGSQSLCMTLTQFNSVKEKLDIGDTFVNALLPSSTLLILMALIVRRSWADRRARAVRQTARDDSLESASSINNGSLKTQTRLSLGRNHEAEQNFFNNLGFVLVFLAVYLLLNLPLDTYRTIDTVGDLVGDSEASLRGFLWEEVLKYLRYTKYAINLFLLLVGYPHFRDSIHALPYRLKQCRPCSRREGNACNSSSIEVTQAQML